MGNATLRDGKIGRLLLRITTWVSLGVIYASTKTRQASTCLRVEPLFPMIFDKPKKRKTSIAKGKKRAKAGSANSAKI